MVLILKIIVLVFSLHKNFLFFKTNVFSLVVSNNVRDNETLITIKNMDYKYKLSKEGHKLVNSVLKNTSWPFIEKGKKHTYIEHCKNFLEDHNVYRKKWMNISGIYKITFLPYKLFTYYGSSVNIGQRIKYHYYNGEKQNNFLGNFIKTFGWSCFSITLIEKCNSNVLSIREDWYLNKFKPLLNYMTKSYADPRKINVMSVFTKEKISKALIGKKHSLMTKKKMSLSKSGSKNYYFGKRLSSVTLKAAQSLKGKAVYVYSVDNSELFNNKPFPSIRETVKHLPISFVTLKSKLDKGVPFKGYYYYSSPVENNIFKDKQ